MKLLEAKGINSRLEFYNELLDIPSRMPLWKINLVNQTLLKLKASALQTTLNRIKAQATDWAKYLKNMYLIKDLHPKYTKYC